MRVLIDTNVILDFYCKRHEFYENAAEIFEMACTGDIDIFISPISFVNFFYITRKVYTIEERYEIMRGLMEICYVADANSKVLKDAMSADVADFEDMVQLHSAIFSEVDCIVTRNVKDFISAPIPVLTPSQFLDR